MKLIVTCNVHLLNFYHKKKLSLIILRRIVAFTIAFVRRDAMDTFERNERKKYVSQVCEFLDILTRVHVQCSVQHSSAHRGQNRFKVSRENHTYTHKLSTQLSSLIDVRFFISI